jgi:hypothetical protein
VITSAAAYQIADEQALLASSYTRIDVVMNAMSTVGFGSDWFRLLGEHWSVCDNLWRWRALLRPILADATREHLDAMMTAQEFSALTALPERITVYRGCYRINRSGLSWTVDRNLAERFPRLTRYSRPGDHPLLLTAVVPRERAVLKLDRGEAEIIPAIARIRPVDVDLLPIEEAA